MKISGAKVLLTGATGGIGAAIARELSRGGGDLVITGRRGDLLAELASETGAEVVECDLTDRRELSKLAAGYMDVDILVNNAGLPGTGHLDAYTEDQIDRALDVNLRAPMLLSSVIGPAMVGRERGHIVFVSSLAGKVASPGGSVYSATKFGLRGFAQSLRQDFGRHGVGVSTVFPGFVRDAGMFAEAEVELPFGVGTSTPEQVARGVCRAIARNRGELDVAPMAMRVATIFGAAMPRVSAAVQRRSGGHEMSEQIGAGQRHKR